MEFVKNWSVSLSLKRSVFSLCCLIELKKKRPAGCDANCSSAGFVPNPLSFTYAPGLGLYFKPGGFCAYLIQSRVPNSTGN